MAADRRPTMAPRIRGAQAGRQGFLRTQERIIRGAQPRKECRNLHTSDHRTEGDSLDLIEVPAGKLWGAQTQCSLEHLRLSPAPRNARISVFGVSVTRDPPPITVLLKRRKGDVHMTQVGVVPNYDNSDADNCRFAATGTMPCDASALQAVARLEPAFGELDGAVALALSD